MFLKRWISQSLPSTKVPTRLVKLHSVSKTAHKFGSTRETIQSYKSECLKRLLQRAFVDIWTGGVDRAVVEIVVLRCEYKCGEPEIGENPGEWGEITLVGLDQGKNQCRKVEERVDGSLELKS